MSIHRMPRRALLKSGSLLAGLPFLPLLNAFPAPASASLHRDCKGYGPASKSYDPTAPGAVTVVDFDTRSRKMVRSFLALSGTIENCAGPTCRLNSESAASQEARDLR